MSKEEGKSDDHAMARPEKMKAPPSQAGLPNGYAVKEHSDGLIEVWRDGRYLMSFASLDEARSFSKSDEEATEKSDGNANQEKANDESQNETQLATEADELGVIQSKSDGNEPETSLPETDTTGRQNTPTVGVDETRRKTRKNRR